MRKLAAIGIALAATFSLSGCAPATFESDVASIKPACETYSSKPGDAASKIEADTSGSGAPKITFPLGINGEEISTKILEEGSGPTFTGNQLVDLEYIGINGGTGKQFQSSSFTGTDFVSQYLQAGQKPDFCHAVSGAKEGSLVAFVVPAKLAHAGQGIADLGIGATDSIVFVFKLLKVFLPRAVGDELRPEAGFPSVVRAQTGEPGITMTGKDAPGELKTAVLVRGRGEQVKQGDVVTVHYTGMVWNGVQFDSSWDNGQPAQFELTKGKLIDGFVQSLDGQTVGSQIIAIIPPDLGYGNQEQSLIPANSTLVFVIDILGTNSK